MPGLPDDLLRHEVTIEDYLGDAAYGPTYAAPVAVRGFLDAKTALVRASDGRQVVSGATFFCPLDTACSTESRVTLPDGRTPRVIVVLRRDGGGLPTPDHLEIKLE